MKPSDHQHQIPIRKAVFYALEGPPKVLDKTVRDPRFLWSYSNYCRAIVVCAQARPFNHVRVVERQIADFNDFGVYKPYQWLRWCNRPSKPVLDYIMLPDAHLFLRTLRGLEPVEKLWAQLGPCRIRYQVNRTDDTYVLYEQQGRPCLKKLEIMLKKPLEASSSDSRLSMVPGTDAPFSYMRPKSLSRR